MCGQLDLYEFAAGKNYHNFDMEYAMSLQQVSTCFLDKDLQFGTWFEQIECCTGDMQTNVTSFEHKMTVEDTKGQICNGSTSQNTLHGR